MAIINPFCRPLFPILVVSCFSPIPIPLATPVFWSFWKNGFSVKLLRVGLSDMQDAKIFAGHVRNAITKMLKKYRAAKVNLTGFSMGGVASLYAIKRLGIAEQVATLVSVAAPFHGSPLGYLGPPTLVYSTSGNQMTPGSEFLQELHSDDLPTGPRYVSISGDRDRVCPFPTAKLNGAENVVLATGHLNTLVDTKIHALIASYFV